MADEPASDEPSVDEPASDAPAEEPPRIADRPGLAAVGIFLVAMFVFGGIELLVTGAVDFLGAALFALVFTAAYVGGAIYLDR